MLTVFDHDWLMGVPLCMFKGLGCMLNSRSNSSLGLLFGIYAVADCIQLKL